MSSPKSLTAYQKKLKEDLDALGTYLVTDMSADQFVIEESGMPFTDEELRLVLKCAEIGDFSEYYRSQSRRYRELPSGAGFAWIG